MQFRVTSEGSSHWRIAAYSDENKAVGFVSLHQFGDRLVLKHTHVDEQFRGQNIGILLVTKAVEYACDNRLKLVATCPYAKRLIEKEPGLKLKLL